MAAQHLDGPRELLAPRPRRGVVEHEHEVGRAGRVEAPLDDLPRLELVRQRDDAEVVAQRRADPGRGRLHRREARHDPHLDVGQRDIAVDDLQHGGGHREDARVARRDDRHARAAGRQLERVARALGLDAVVGRVAALPASLGHAREVGLVADQLLGGRQLGVRLRRQPVRARGPEPDDAHAPGAGRCARAGTKLGTSTSDM